MLPTSQMLFLLLLYNNKPFLKKDAAEALQLARTSITWASAQLSALNLIIEERRGREIFIRPVAVVKLFLEYIQEENYRCGWKNSSEFHFYRFTDPEPGYSVQIELFSRLPEYHLEAKASIVPIYIDDDTQEQGVKILRRMYL